MSRCQGLEAEAIVYAILKHEMRWGATDCSISEAHKRGRRARRDLAVALRNTIESEELSLWLQALEPTSFPVVPRYPSIMQTLLLGLPNDRKRFGAACPAMDNACAIIQSLSEASHNRQASNG